MKKLMKRFKNERGLTLVELLAVIVVLAIISVIGFVYIGGIIENSKKDAHIANAQQIISAAKLHEATGGTFPDGTDAVTVADLQDNDYLDKVLIDPWTKAAYEGALDATITITITVDGNLFKISNFAGSSGDCTITATEQDLATKDRKELCESGKSSGNGTGD